MFTRSENKIIMVDRINIRVRRHKQSEMQNVFLDVESITTVCYIETVMRLSLPISLYNNARKVIAVQH